MNHVSKIIIIIIEKKKITTEIKKGKGNCREREKGRAERDFYFLFFFLFASFSNLRKLDRRISSEQGAKFFHTLRATRGCQNLGVSSNSTR